MEKFMVLFFLLSAFSFAVQAGRRLDETSARRDLLDKSNTSGSLANEHTKKHVHAPNKKHVTNDSVVSPITHGTIVATGTAADFEHIFATSIPDFDVEPTLYDTATEVRTVHETHEDKHKPAAVGYKPVVKDYGGPYMQSGASVYLIFVSGYSNSKKKYTGDGWPSATITTIKNFFKGISSTSVFKHLSAYGVHPVTSVLGSISLTLNTDTTVMSGGWAASFVQYVVQYGYVSPASANKTIFHVLTDTGLVPWNDTQMCVGACGWHTTTYFNNVEYIYTWIPQPQACAARGVMCYQEGYPTADPYTQGLISTLYHETVEAMTDYNDDAWHDQDDNEIMDLCVWQYGTVSTYFNSTCNCYESYNTKVGSSYYLLQGMYVISGSKQVGCKWT